MARVYYIQPPEIHDSIWGFRFYAEELEPARNGKRLSIAYQFSKLDFELDIPPEELILAIVEKMDERLDYAVQQANKE